MKEEHRTGVDEKIQRNPAGTGPGQEQGEAGSDPGAGEAARLAEAGRPRLSRIVFVITRADDLGGAQVHVLEMASALKERGFEVEVLAGGDGVLFEALSERGVSCRKLEKMIHPIRPATDLAALRELRGLLQELKPDLVTTHSNKAGFLGRLAARSLNIPVLHTSHGFLFNRGKRSLSGRFYRFMEKNAARAGDKVIAVSRSEFEAARELKVIPAQKMAVVHNGLPDVGEGLRADPSLEPPNLVMVARFAAPKDHGTLLKALGGLKDKQWSLDLVGDGPGAGAARELVRKLGLEERVNFLGSRGDVPQLLASAQVFVLSSRREGFPLSILEAMRAGLPVAASRVGGVGEAVVDGKSGLLFAPGDVKGLREQLKTLIDDPGLREAMGEAGRRRFTELFSLDQMVEKTIQVYESLI